MRTADQPLPDRRGLTILAALLMISVRAAADAPLFVDVARAAGIDFAHFNGMTGKDHFPEMMGAGAAWIDYDRDGDLDLYLVQGTTLAPGETIADALIPPTAPLSDRLYRNDSADGRLRFVDVTDAAGLDAGGYGMGVSVGDPNNDGWPDLYLSNFGPNQLWINRGNGTFSDATVASGADDGRWSVTAVFFDYDGDGWQDLYVVNYVRFSFATAKTCRSHYDAPDYCSPQSYRPASDRLLRNRGDGTFENATAKAGIESAEGPGLGAVSGDFNGDGRVDLYVANDGAANFLWLNQGEGRFRDEALLAGVAVNMTGAPEASMGVDAGDFDGDGDLDLFMTHLERQTNTLYVNEGQGWFTDRSTGSALAASSFPFTGFGTLWFDFDNDGWLDLLSANGAVIKDERQLRAGDKLPLKQRNQVWRNRGDGTYEDVSTRAGPAFGRPRVSRGAAFGDADNDGDTDVVLTNNAGPAELLENRVGQRRSWLGLQLLNRWGGDALGAKADLALKARTLARRVRVDGSYASAHDPRVLFGLADRREPVDVVVTWPNGSRQTLAGLELNRYHRIRQSPPP